MTDKPSLRLSTRYIAACLGNSALFFGEDQNYCFDGDSYTTIVRHLGATGLAEPKSDPPNELSDDPLRSAEIQLAKVGILTGRSQPDTPRSAYWENFGCLPSQAEVEITNLVPSCDAMLRHALSSNGIELHSTGNFLVVVTDDYLRPEVPQFGRRSSPWLLAKP